ncbi:sensor domain-containing diguanylate cyclase [Metabacillus litoralis]|uniref:GGDEF domain-containing protein n=1 Tax=Metabacillus litoralis TaxID=152268 RepID=UPI001CFEA1C8|nr:sensor domain-containing diguanylate cyclase [Metabacillus litoralis]
MNKKIQVALWLCWITITPVLLWIAYQLAPPTFNGLEIDILSFLLLMCLVSFWPIIINETPVFYVQGVSLVVFLYFGVFIEMILTQIAVIVLLLKVRISVKDLFRYPLNSLLFSFVSIGGAIVYYMVGGSHGRIIFSDSFLSAIISYELTVFLLNQLLLNILQFLIYKKKFNILTRSFLWEFFTSLIIFPIGIALYFLYLEVGIEAIIFIGTPLLALSIILTLYYKTQQINHYLQRASEIGHQLTGRLNIKNVLDIFMDRVTAMIPLDAAYIIDVNENDKIKIVRKYENGAIDINVEEPKSPDRGLSGHVYVMRQSVLFHTRKQWRHIQQSQLPHSVESVIAVPVMRNQELIGIVILASNKKYAFDKAQLMIIDLLSAYLGVAVENAKNYQETKRQSEHCSLTGLYNYRYLEATLEQNFIELKQQKMQTLSLILLDIDHFKAVNDTYGHHAGNEVLIQLSHRLLKAFRHKGTIARYGGEEFVILLKDHDKKQTMNIAEEVRLLIANTPFDIEQTLQSTNSTISVFITASIGVAMAPYDAEDAISLVRHADRAMYTGAKRAGRNKVAEYVS